MSFQTVPINITGPTYQDRSRPLSSQETRNFYHEVVESGRDKYVIKSFPGQTNFGSATAGNDYGSHQMGEVTYRVIYQTLYEVSVTGAHTSRGTLTTNERCLFADDGVNLYVVAGGVVSQYNSTTQLLTTVTDVNIVGAQSVTFINNFFIYTFPTYSQVSDAGDGSSASGLNSIGEEGSPDNLVRDYSFDDRIYRFGTRTCYLWWVSGSGNPPIERVSGQKINIGLNAKHSVNNTKNYIYWLGSDNQVYRARGGQEEVVSTAAVSGAIQSYSDTSDAYAEVFTIDNKQIYMLSFPTANKTWALIEQYGKDGWILLSSGTSNDIFNAGSIVECYNKILIGDRLTGDLNYLDFNSYDINGSTWQRRRVISSVNGDALGAKGKRVQMSRLEFIMEMGTGLITGQGEDPKIMIEASYDGGKSWKPGSWLRIGRLGETAIRAEWFNLMSFYDMMVRITTSDPVAINIYSGAIDLRLAGR